MDAQRTLEPCKGLSGVYTRTLKSGDLAYYVSVKKRDGSWTFRAVGRHSKGMRPKVAAAALVRLQEELDGGRIERGEVSFGEAYRAYLGKRRARGSSTIRDEERWRVWLSRFERVPLSRLTTADFERLQGELREKGRSEGYQEKILGQARTIIGWAIRDDLWVGKNPLGRESSFVMPSWRRSARPSYWFSPEEASLLLETIRKISENWYRMSLLSLRTGMRAMEIFHLGRLGNALDPAQGRLWFHGKSGKVEFVEAGPDIIHILADYNRKPGELIFQNRRGGQITKVSYTFGRAVKLAGITSPSHHIWFHSWRHTYGSWLAQSGKFTLQEIMAAMRHTDLRMTLHYAQLIPGNMGSRLGIIAERLAEGSRQS